MENTRPDITIIPIPFLSQGAVRAHIVVPNPEEESGGRENSGVDFSKYALTPVQTHSCNVGVVNNRWERFPDTDALITFQKNLPIGIRTADCVPILMYAERIEAIAAIHAGWRGSLNGIVDKTMEVLMENGADPDKIFVSFGPSISQKNYEVDSSLAKDFIDAGFAKFVSHDFGDKKKPHIDLQGINAERIMRKGVPAENIDLSDVCTFEAKNSKCEFIYPSYRRNGTKARLLTVISLSEESL